MMYSKKIFILFIATFFSCRSFAFEPERPVIVPPDNWYTFIGWDYEKYKADLDQKIKEIKEGLAVLLPGDALAQQYEKINELEQKLKNLKTQLNQRKQESALLIEGGEEKIQTNLARDIEKTEQDLAVENKKYEIMLFRHAYKDPQFAKKWNVKKDCKDKRKKIDEDIEALEIKLKSAALFGPARTEKENQILKLQMDKEFAPRICSFLADAKRRAEHEYELQEQQVENWGDVFQRLSKGISQAMLVQPRVTTILNDILGSVLEEELPKLVKGIFGDIPVPAAKLFNQNIALKQIGFLARPQGPDVIHGLGMTGLVGFNELDLRISVYVVQTLYGKPKFSIAVQLPEQYKPSQLIPALSFLDTFSFPKSKLVLSTFPYGDRDGFFIQQGLNFVADVDLSGPLQLLSDLKDQSTITKSLVFENKPVKMFGTIAFNRKKPAWLDLERSRFSLDVPFYFGVDLTKVFLVPAFLSKTVNKVTTDEFRFSIKPVYKPAGLSDKRNLVKEFPFEMETEAGARITLGTQKDPLNVTLLGLCKPSFKTGEGEINLAGNLKHMLQLKWLAIGDATLQFGWQEKLMPKAAEKNVPFTMVGLKGKLDLGKPGDSRAHLNIAGAWRISDLLPIDEWLLQAEGTNIRFADMLQYVSYLASRAKILKAPFDVEKIPTLTFDKVWGHAFLGKESMKIGNTFYSPGVGMQGETQLFNKKFGCKFLIGWNFDKDDIKEPRLNFSGFGYMPHINFSWKNKEFLKLYGMQTDRGPRLDFNFNPVNPSQGNFSVSGTLEVPPLLLKEQVLLNWYGWNLTTNFASKIAGLSMVFGVKINLKQDIEHTIGRFHNTQVIQNELDNITDNNDANRLQLIIDALRRTEQNFITVLDYLPADVVAKAKQAGENLAIADVALKEEKQPLEIKKLLIEANQLYGEAVLSQVSPLQKIEKATITFGFKDDFAEYLAQVARKPLEKLRDTAMERLDKLARKMNEWYEAGIPVAQQEIESIKADIEKTKERIEQARKKCSQAKWTQKYRCAEFAAQNAILLRQKAYLNALVKPRQAVVGQVKKISAQVAQKISQVQAVRKATQSLLDWSIKALDLIQSGLTIFRVREAIGSYSWNDFISGKLPKINSLVVDVSMNFQQLLDGIELLLDKLIGDEELDEEERAKIKQAQKEAMEQQKSDPMTISLRNIQFDFKNIGGSIQDITYQLMTSINNKYLSKFAELGTELMK